MVEVVANKTYIICLYAPKETTLAYIRLKTQAGTCTANFQVDGVSITGANAVAVTSTEQNVPITQVVPEGSTVSVIISANNLATDLAIVMGAA
jgi:hypothetical protein